MCKIIKTEFNEENPLHANNIPVAKLVVIDVEGQPIIEPKSRPICDALENAWSYIYLAWLIFTFFGMLGGLIIFLYWLYNPYL